jgi:hypothetical protein
MKERLTRTELMEYIKGAAVMRQLEEEEKINKHKDIIDSAMCDMASTNAAHEAWLKENPSRYYAVHGTYPTTTPTIEEGTTKVLSLMDMINRRRS